MSRTKGSKNRSWSKDEKLCIIHRYFIEGIDQCTLVKEENISRGMINNWISKYLNEG